MMKMDHRDSAECQNWEKNDVNVIFEIVKLEKDKTQIVFVSFIKQKERKRQRGLFLIFVRNIGSPDIHEYSAG